MWVVDGEDHLNGSGGVEHVVSETDDGFYRISVCGSLGYKLVITSVSALPGLPTVEGEVRLA